MSSARNKRLVVSALMLALALVLPYFTGGIPAIGNLLLPMHLPVLLCGFLCGGGWGAGVGLAAPLLRSLLAGRPEFFPTAFSMAFELAAYGLISGLQAASSKAMEKAVAAYGLISGLLYRRLPKNAAGVYASLAGAMVGGRMVWGAVRALITLASPTPFGLAIFWTEAVLNAIPGILLQLVLIPALVLSLQRARLSPVQ